MIECSRGEVGFIAVIVHVRYAIHFRVNIAFSIETDFDFGRFFDVFIDTGAANGIFLAPFSCVFGEFVSIAEFPVFC